MKETNAVPRLLIPVLGTIALALVVQGLPAQDRDEAKERAEERDRAEIVHRAPAPSPMSLWTGRPGAYLGAYIREVTSEDVERLDLDEERGALITQVPDEGPAAGAGLRADDVIVSWNGTRIESAAQLRRMIGETPAGRTARVGYVRGGDDRTAAVELAARSSRALVRQFGYAPLDENVRARVEESMESVRGRLRALQDGDGALMFVRGGRLGIGVQNLTDQLADYFGADGGVLVTTVRENSPAAEAGLRAGDVILRVGEDEVENPGDLMRTVARAEAGEIELRIVREGGERTVRANLPERSGVGEIESGTYWFGPSTGAFQFDGDGAEEFWSSWGDMFEDMGEGFGAFEAPAIETFRFEAPAPPEIELHAPPAPGAPLEAVRT